MNNQIAELDEIITQLSVTITALIKKHGETELTYDFLKQIVKDDKPFVLEKTDRGWLLKMED